ncbi:pentapeptide repeat-containing protein [Streptomyces sp. NPDC005393]|uniref:pentapeptide repeat-containing protein n=1 Tax=Streptomyces sp. NPDC005393 TaxID=3157041 RepID=UPI0033A84373
MSTPPPSIPGAPSRTYCAHGADPTADPVGCRGIHVPGHTACLAHLSDADRDTYLAGLTPGADIDHGGTPFTQALLNQLLSALRDPTTGKPHLGTAGFDRAQFSGEARFDGTQFSGGAGFHEAQFSRDARFDEAQFSRGAAFYRAHFSRDAVFDRAQFSGTAGFVGTQFSGHAGFDGAQFSGTAGFVDAQFSGHAGFVEAQFSRDARFDEAQFSSTTRFDRAQFSDHAGFDGAQFSGHAGFREAQFSGHAGFDGAQFSGYVGFHEAQFSGDVRFDGAQFSGDVGFDGAQLSGTAGFGRTRFTAASGLGPLVCAALVDLSGAVFEVPVTLEIAARRVRCERTRWESTATVRVRYARANLGHAVLSAPVAVVAHPAPFASSSGHTVDESLLSGCHDGVRVASVEGVDAAHLVLTHTDLTDCLFSGAFHLDQLRLEGRTIFAPTPTGWHRRGLRLTRWTRRRTLAEEHHWRARRAGQPAPPPGHTLSPRQWRPGPHHPDPGLTPDPENVAALYRQLRKAFEDGKNEPGAADFYYGECEMRRHDRTGTAKGERHLLWAYWLLSGYGLRASRAFAWLLAAMSLTVLLLMGVGLPTHDPDPATTGTLDGSKISLNTTTPDPTLHGGWSKRMTWARAEKATRVAVNSVIFRSSGQNLTTWGTYIEMISRLLEPTLLALGALAIRGRIKR